MIIGGVAGVEPCGTPAEGGSGQDRRGRWLRSLSLSKGSKLPSSRTWERGGDFPLHMLKVLDFFFIHAREENAADCEGEHFCNREGPPYVINVSGKRQKPCNRQQENQLANKAYNHRLNAFTQSLENRTKNNADCGQREVNGDDAQSLCSD